MDKLVELMASIPKDKLLHSFYGVLVYLIAALVTPLFGVICTVLVAIAKDIYDKHIYGGFDWKDIIATVGIPLLLFTKDVYAY